MEQNVQSPQQVTTRSVGFKFGLISCAIGIAIFLVTAVMGTNPFSSTISWISIPVGIIILILAQKNFKDSGDGFMSYGQGVGIAFWQTLTSVVISTVFMYVYLSFIDGAPMELFYDEQRAKMEEANAPDEAIEMSMEWTRKLFWLFAIIGGLFWGMLVGLIVTIFTQKKAPEQAF